MDRFDVSNGPGNDFSEWWRTEGTGRERSGFFETKVKATLMYNKL